MLKMYAIYDNKSRCYNEPMFVRTDSQAMRQFIMVMSDTKYHLSKFPNEFDLHRLGMYDELTGKIDQLEGASVILTGAAAVTKLQNEQEVRNDSKA